MIDFKEIPRKDKSRSLYFGLFRSITVGLILAVIAFFLLFISSIIGVNEMYLTDEKKADRREEYLYSLVSFVDENGVGLTTVDTLSEWVRANPYVFLLVYYKADAIPASMTPDVDAPDASYRSIEFPGARIDDSLDSEELIKEATAGGYHRIELAEGSIIVSLSEYSEEFYYSTFGTVSIAAAAIVFILVIVNYVRVIIERIKRFESDVTIVSEMDMDYEIISDGADEIARLSSNVERMRRRMLDHIKSEQEARQANTELITSISHDIRTPLTVLMGYIEMMKEQECDEIMQSYIASTENTALRLKQLSDDMFKYSLAFGDTKGMITLEEYDALTLFDQLLSEHMVLMHEMGYEIFLEHSGDTIEDGAVVVTDAQNLMRIIDNIFSNLRKYADINHPIMMNIDVGKKRMVFECRNKIRTDTEGAESNGIGLKTCARLASLVADKFEYGIEDEEFFVTRLSLDFRQTYLLDAEVADGTVQE